MDLSRHILQSIQEEQCSPERQGPFQALRDLLAFHALAGPSGDPNLRIPSYVGAFDGRIEGHTEYLWGDISVHIWSQVTHRPLTERFWSAGQLREEKKATSAVTVVGNIPGREMDFPHEAENKKVILDVTALLTAHKFNLLQALNEVFPVIHVTPFCLPALLEDLQKIPRHSPQQLRFLIEDIQALKPHRTFELHSISGQIPVAEHLQLMLKEAKRTGSCVILLQPPAGEWVKGKQWVPLRDVLVHMEDELDLDPEDHRALRGELGIEEPTLPSPRLPEVLWLPHTLMDVLFRHRVIRPLARAFTVRIEKQVLESLELRYASAMACVDAACELKGLIHDLASRLQQGTLKMVPFPPGVELGVAISSVKMDEATLYARFPEMGQLMWMEDLSAHMFHHQEKFLSSVVSLVGVMEFLKTKGKLRDDKHVRLIRRLQNRGHLYLPLDPASLLHDLARGKTEHWERHFETILEAMHVQSRPIGESSLTFQYLKVCQAFVLKVCEALWSTRPASVAGQQTEWLFRHLFAGAATHAHRGTEGLQEDALEHDACEIAMHMTRQGAPAALVGFLNWIGERATQEELWIPVLQEMKVRFMGSDAVLLDLQQPFVAWLGKCLS